MSIVEFYNTLKEFHDSSLFKFATDNELKGRFKKFLKTEKLFNHFLAAARGDIDSYYNKIKNQVDFLVNMYSWFFGSSPKVYEYSGRPDDEILRAIRDNFKFITEDVEKTKKENENDREIFFEAIKTPTKESIKYMQKFLEYNIQGTPVTLQSLEEESEKRQSRKREIPYHDKPSKRTTFQETSSLFRKEEPKSSTSSSSSLFWEELSTSSSSAAKPRTAEHRTAKPRTAERVTELSEFRLREIFRNDFLYVLSQFRPFTVNEIDDDDFLEVRFRTRLCKNIQMHGIINQTILKRCKPADAIFVIDDFIITKLDILSLYGTTWIEDPIINCIAKMYNAKILKETNIHFFQSPFTAVIDNLEHSAVDLEIIGRRKKEIFLIPLVKGVRSSGGGGSHYVSAIVNTATRNIVYNDSMYKGDITIPTDLFNTIVRVFNNSLQIDVSRYNQIIYTDGPVQEDGYNCGLYTLLFFESYIWFRRLFSERQFNRICGTNCQKIDCMNNYRFFILSLIYNQCFKYSIEDCVPIYDREVNYNTVSDFVKLEVDAFKYGLVKIYDGDGFDFSFGATCKSMYMYVNECMLRTSGQITEPGKISRQYRGGIIRINERKQRCLDILEYLAYRTCNDMKVLLLLNVEDLNPLDDIYKYDLIIYIDQEHQERLLVPYYFYPRNHLLIKYCNVRNQFLEDIRTRFEGKIPGNSDIKTVIYDETNPDDSDRTNPARARFDENNLTKNLVSDKCPRFNRYVSKNIIVQGIALDMYNPDFDHDVQTVLITDCILTNKSFYNALLRDERFLTRYQNFIYQPDLENVIMGLQCMN